MVIKRRQQTMTSYCTSSKTFLLGVVLGFAFFMLTRFAIVPCLLSSDHTLHIIEESQHENFVHEDSSMTRTSTTDQNLVVIGIMSAKQFLESRVIPSFDTWVTTIPGKVSFVSHLFMLC